MTLQEIIACIDLTSLNVTDTEDSTRALCLKAQTELGPVAAICCYPQFVRFARSVLPKSILIATVVNFPAGENSLSQIEAEVHFALEQGTDEIDLVIPYQKVIQGDLSSSTKIVECVKALCADKSLKVIIETGELKDPELIFRLSTELLQHGADFIKTSTGKVATGATEEAVTSILKALWRHYQKTGELKGLKVSGGVKTPAEAKLYMNLAEEYFNADYLQPRTFRIGASSLLDEVLALHS